MAGRKIFVGSLPNQIDDATLRTQFSKYGFVEDVFVKANCESGRQWAFITFQTQDQANSAKDACDRVLHFPGAERPCDVMLAKNQGLYGQEPLGGHSQGYSQGGAPLGGMQGPRKIFVGSLPDGCSEGLLRGEFSRYGAIEDVFLKPNCEPGRQFAFVLFADHEQASAAAAACNGVLQFQGTMKPCEVTLARNQGMFGQGAIDGGRGSAQPGPGQYNAPSGGSGGPSKIFVGSLPDQISESALRNEFSRYGQITDVYLKAGCEPGRQWGFISFASSQQALTARDSCDRKLVFPGASQACEVTMARNQGRFGQDPVRPAPGAVGGGSLPPQGGGYQGGGYQGGGYQNAMAPPGQPPPPSSPPPPHLTPWREYKTVAGLPYYHNHTTGLTQWETPRDLQGISGARHSPY